MEVCHTDIGGTHAFHAHPRHPNTHTHTNSKCDKNEKMKKKKKRTCDQVGVQVPLAAG